ncbi:MAG: hypothetical protein U0790_14180 [Isosphaeraceae bacterium]
MVNGLGRMKIVGGLTAAVCLASVLLAAAWIRDRWLEKRVQVVVPGRLVRGAWQRSWPLRRIIEREGIRTIVTLTAINSSDPKFVDQAAVVRETGIRWLIVPMRGSRGTPEQMALAADLLADPACQPVYFHCVAGHHRTSLAHAAYLVRHEGFTAEQAWRAVSSLPWARPDSLVDRNDRFLIEEFARIQGSLFPSRERGVWEIGHETLASEEGPADRPGGDVADGAGTGLDRLDPGDAQLRRHPARATLPIGPDARRDAGDHPPRPDDPDRPQPQGAQSGGGLVPS